ncbi:unnamed protein product [Urochloa humidicola]
MTCLSIALSRSARSEARAEHGLLDLGGARAQVVARLRMAASEKSPGRRSGNEAASSRTAYGGGCSRGCGMSHKDGAAAFSRKHT